MPNSISGPVEVIRGIVEGEAQQDKADEERERAAQQ